MFVFQKVRKIQKMLYTIDMQNQRIFGNTERRLYQTEAEKIAKELKKSANLDFIELTVEIIFREGYKNEFIYDPEKIQQISMFLMDLTNNSMFNKISDLSRKTFKRIEEKYNEEIKK
ncbi:MAG: hypothetical protein GX638_06895 [Crenarchaeota archaeon]|nr:hypothetical protein [Thermoproteota archaeon]